MTHAVPKLVQLELPMSWPAPPPHGVALSAGGYARRVRCAVTHPHGRGFLYVSSELGDAAFECGNCGRHYSSSALRSLQRGSLL